MSITRRSLSECGARSSMFWEDLTDGCVFRLARLHPAVHGVVTFRVQLGLLRAMVDLPRIRRVTGLLAGLALCFIPDLYVYSGLVMADILAGVFMFWAAYFWYRYMLTEQTSLSVTFGVLAACAILTKANPGVLFCFPFRPSC